MNEEEPHSKRQNLPRADHGQEEVPTYGCLVHISRLSDGRLKGHVANLTGIQHIAPTERELLQEIVSTFKEVVGEHLKDEIPIPWIEPPIPLDSNETKRFIPIHL